MIDEHSADDVTQQEGVHGLRVQNEQIEYWGGIEMTLFERLKEWYPKGYVRKDQLQRFVQLGALTKEEYEEITGEEFVA